MLVGFLGETDSYFSFFMWATDLGDLLGLC